MTTTSENPPSDDSEPSLPGLIARPPYQLISLPIPTRWEVTRRHGYYQNWWQLASESFINAPLRYPDDPREPFLRSIAGNLLWAIGVSGNPPDPATEFNQLDPENPNCVSIYTAIQPLSFRALAGMCLKDLPKDTLHALGCIFVKASREDDENAKPQLVQAIEQLAQCDEAGLNSYPDAPFVAINPAASQRQIQASLQALLPRWREERNLEEHRNRSDRYSDYLRVWDLREGWRSGRYDPSQEKTFRAIANEQRENYGTVVSHYRSAFELIVGHPYSPSIWFSVFGPLKFSDLLNSVGRVSRSRPIRSPVRRPVPESALQNGSPSSSPGIASMTAVPSGILGTDLFLDLQDLIASGWTDAQIATELDLQPHSLPLLADFRERLNP